MPAISHHGHYTNVHSGFAPGTIIATASNFTVSGQMVARVGDLITPHSHPNGAVHPAAKISQGSTRFSVGGKAVARINDSVNCGAKINQGFGGFMVGE